MFQRTQSRKHYSYHGGFKFQTVEMSLTEGLQVKHVADFLGVHLCLLSRWRKEQAQPSKIEPDSTTTQSATPAKPADAKPTKQQEFSR